MWQPRSLRRLKIQLDALNPLGLAITHADQVDQLGPCLSVIADWRLPLLWVSRGTELPEDLEPATPELLAELVYAGIDRSPMNTTFA